MLSGRYVHFLNYGFLRNVLIITTLDANKVDPPTEGRSRQSSRIGGEFNASHFLPNKRRTNNQNKSGNARFQTGSLRTETGHHPSSA